MDVSNGLFRHQVATVFIFAVIKGLVKKVRKSKFKVVLQKCKFLSPCAIMRSRKHIFLTHIHMVCMARGFKQFELAIFQLSNFLVDKLG